MSTTATTLVLLRSSSSVQQRRRIVSSLCSHYCLKRRYHHPMIGKCTYHEQYQQQFTTTTRTSSIMTTTTTSTKRATTKTTSHQQQQNQRRTYYEHHQQHYNHNNNTNNNMTSFYKFSKNSSYFYPLIRTGLLVGGTTVGMVQLQQEHQQPTVQSTTYCDAAAATATDAAATAHLRHPNDNIDSNDREHSDSKSTSSSNKINNMLNATQRNINDFANRIVNIRKHQTIQKLQDIAIKEDTIESKYNINWDEPLGEGSFGKVYLATLKNSDNMNEQYAVKKIYKQYTDNITFQREMDALIHLREQGGHPHICGLHENYNENQYYYLLLDLIVGCEMFDHLCHNGAYSEADAARLIREVSNALAFLHGIGIVHGDMKPENLMLSSSNSSDAVIKIVDFGCAQTIIEDEDGNIIDSLFGEDDDDSPTGTANTPAYCPPEVLEKKHEKYYNNKTSDQKQKKTLFDKGNKKEGEIEHNNRIDPSFDMWALGVILYIMLTGVHPFDLYGNASDAEIEHQILSRQRPPIRNSPLTAHLSKDAIDVIDKLIQWDPKKRLSAQDLLQHPWVSGKTASTNKMADSDKRLSAYRAFKTKLEAKVFADMALLTINSNDDDYEDDENIIIAKKNNDTPDENLLLNGFGEEIKNGAKVHNYIENKNNNDNDINNTKTKTKKRYRTSTDHVAKRTSLLEMAFHRLDPQKKGYVTTSDLQKLSSTPNVDGKNNETDKSATDNDTDHLSLSGFSDLLAENMKNRYFPKGHVIYHEGDIGHAMYFINSGSIEVYTRDGFTKTLRTPGDFFGEGALLHPKKIRSASIRCLTPVHAIEISREYFEKYMASDSNVKLNLREKDKSRKRQRAKAMLRLQNSMEERTYPNNTTLFKVGDEGEELFILEEGNIDISVQNHHVFTLHPGEMCGEHSLLLGKPRNTTATCKSPNGCKVHVLRSRDFFALLDSHPGMKESLRDICLRREFQKAMCSSTKHSFPRTESELMKAFYAIDTNKSGSLELPNIRDLIVQFDPSYTDDDIIAILNTLDLDETGSVSWDEFKRIFGMDRKLTTKTSKT